MLVLEMTEKASVLADDRVDPQTETSGRCNFIISMRTAGRLLNNSRRAPLGPPRWTLSTLIKNAASRSTQLALRRVPSLIAVTGRFVANIAKKRRITGPVFVINLLLSHVPSSTLNPPPQPTAFPAHPADKSPSPQPWTPSLRKGDEYSCPHAAVVLAIGRQWWSTDKPEYPRYRIGGKKGTEDRSTSRIERSYLPGFFQICIN